MTLDEKQRIKAEIVRRQDKKREEHERRKNSRCQSRSPEEDKDIDEYYRSFADKPADFRGRRSAPEYSSSEERSESSDDFPSPDTPRRHRNGEGKNGEKDTAHVEEQLKDVHRRLYELEIQYRKLHVKVKNM
jgi:hypothetical protein